MAENLREFLISYGFQVDHNSRAKAESDTRAAEGRITAGNAAALRQRLDAENKATAERIRIALAAGEQLTADDRRFVLEQEKVRIAASDSDKKRQERDAKTGREHREETLKQIRATALKVVGVVTGLVTAIEGAAAGIFVAADKAAKSLEQLNYSAQLSGATPKSINAIVYALTQLGDSSDDAQKSLSNFGNNLEKYKAFEDVLKSMHIQTRDVNGQLRDTGELFIEYSEKLKDLPRAQREAMSTGWGISEESIQAATRPGFRGRYAEGLHDQAAAGNDVDANAQSGTQFEQSARHLRNQAGNIAGRVTGNLFEQLQPQLDKLSKWMDEHGQQVGEILDRIAADIIKLATAVIDNLAKVDWNAVLTKVEDFAKGFDKLAKEYFGEEGSLTVPFVLFGAVLASKVLSPLNGILATMRLLSLLSLPPWLAALLAYTGAGAAASIETAKAIQKADPAKNDLYIDPATGVGMSVAPGEGNQATGGLGDTSNSILGRAWTWAKGKLGFGGGGNAGEKNWWTADRQSHAVDVLMKEGGLTEDGAKALVSRWKNVESAGGPTSVNPNSGAAGIAQGLGSRREGYTGTFDEQLLNAAHELNSSESRAKGLLNTSGMEATGASAFERAEGYDPRTGRDNFTDRTAAGMASIVHGVPASTAPATTSDEVGDTAYAAALARRQALTGRDPKLGFSSAERIQWQKDSDLIDAYHKQQATPQASGSVSLARAHHYFKWIDASSKLANQSGDLTTVDHRSAEDALRAKMSPERRALFDAMKAGSPAMKLPTLTRPLGDTHAVRQSISNSTRGDTTVTHNPTFNVSTNDVRAGMDAARMVADRGNRDLIRNVVGMEA